MTQRLITRTRTELQFFLRDVLHHAIPMVMPLLPKRSRQQLHEPSRRTHQPAARGLHSSTFRLNLSTFCGIGGAFSGCLGGVLEVSGGIGGCLGCIFVSETAQVELKRG
jgi:hypothetical protein